MSQVSRPVQILLLATVLFGMVWFVALRPKSSTTSAGSSPAPAAQSQPDAPGAKGLARAVAKAHGAVGTANSAAQRSAGGAAVSGAAATGAAAKAATPAHTATPAHVHAVKHAAKHAARAHAVAHLSRADAAKLARVRRAVRHHQAIAIAFVDPRIADARAVAADMRHVSTFHGRAVVLSVPIAELSRYGVITRDVQVVVAPTTVIVGRDGQATTIVGASSSDEIQQRLADALAVKP